MFLNVLPIISFLIICIMLLASDYMVHKKIFPEHLANKNIAGAVGLVTLFWALLQFYSNFDFLLYSFRFNYIGVILRFLIMIYFIACGFVLSFKGYGNKLYRSMQKSQENYYKTKVALVQLQSLLAKIGVILLVIVGINYIFSIIDIEI